MKFIDNIIRYFSRNKSQTVKRGFNAGRVDRQTRTWSTDAENINYAIKSSLPAMRARSRNLAYNDPYIKKYLKTITKYVIGPDGFTFRSKIYDLAVNDKGKQVPLLNDRLNSLIETGFYKWSNKKYCTVEKNLSFRQLLGVILRTTAIDGELFIKKVYVNKKLNPFGFTLQLIESQHVDEGLNAELSNGNVIIMGIEYNKDGETLAYYLKKYTYDPAINNYLQSRDYTRIPASDIYHIYRKEFADQRRGYPDTAVISERAYTLQGYEDAALKNARSGAMKVNVLEPVPDSDEDEINNGTYGTASSEDGEDVIIKNIAPGETYIVPRGYTHKDYNPAFPQMQHGAFTSTMLQGIASGLDVDHPTLASNLKDVNYSSTRHGLLDARIGYKERQNDVIEDVCNPITSDWLESAILNRYFEFDLSNFEYYNNFTFYGFTGDWVDPLRDMTAIIMGLENNILTHEEVAAQKGKDLNELFEQIAYEKTLKKTLGIETTESKNTTAKRNSEIIRRIK